MNHQIICKGTKFLYTSPSPKPFQFSKPELYFLIEIDFIEEDRSVDSNIIFNKGYPFLNIAFVPIARIVMYI